MGHNKRPIICTTAHKRKGERMGKYLKEITMNFPNQQNILRHSLESQHTLSRFKEKCIQAHHSNMSHTLNTSSQKIIFRKFPDDQVVETPTLTAKGPDSAPGWRTKILQILLSSQNKTAITKKCAQSFGLFLNEVCFQPN